MKQKTVKSLTALILAFCTFSTGVSAATIDSVKLNAGKISVEGDSSESSVSYKIYSTGASGESIDDICEMGEAEVKDGKFSFELKMPHIIKGTPTNGEYRIEIKDKTKTSKTFLFAAYTYQSEFLTQLNQKSTAQEMFELFDGKSSDQMYDNTVIMDNLGADAEYYAALDSAGRSGFASVFAAEKGTAEVNSQTFSELYSKAMTVVRINSEEVTGQQLAAAGLEFEGTGYADTDDSALKAWIADIIGSGGEYGSYSEIEQKYIEANILYRLNNARHSEYDALVGKYDDVIGITGEEYYRRYGSMTSAERSSVNTALRNSLSESPVRSVNAFKERYSAAINGASTDKTQPAAGGGGGGGAFAGDGGKVTSVAPERLNPTVQVPEFSDLDRADWARTAIMGLARAGVVSGYDDGSFKPDQSVTREEFVKMVIIALGEELNKPASGFEDVDQSEWYAPYINAAYSKQIILGISDTEFGIGRKITREDMAVIIARLAGGDPEGSEKDLFADDEKIADYAKDSVYRLYNLDKIDGLGENMFGPKELLTRAQAAKIIYDTLLPSFVKTAVNSSTGTTVKSVQAAVEAASGATAAAIADDDYMRLYHLNILSDTYEAYSKKKTVSMKEFLSALIAITTDEKVGADKAFEYARSRNMVSSISSGDADSAIDYERALSLSLNILGYAAIVEMNGGGTGQILKQASDSKLTKGIPIAASDNLDGKTMIKLLSNLIEADIVSMTVTTGVAYTKTDKDPLYSYRDIKKLRGIVTRTEETALYSDRGCGEGRIGIDNSIYYIDYEYPVEMLGREVYVYVKDDKALHVEPVRTDISRIEIDGSDIVGVSDDFSELTYRDGSRDRKLNLSPSMTVVYNGITYNGYTKSDLMPDTGSLTALDTDDDNRYDFVFIQAYETMVVKNVSASYKLITGVYNFPNALNELDLGSSDIKANIYSDGQPVGFSAIAVNDVLCVARSKGSNAKVDIYVSKARLNGTLNIINTGDDKNYFTIDGTPYEVIDAYFDSLADANSDVGEVSVGERCIFYMDIFGRIAYAARDGMSEYEYAYFLRQKGDGLEEDLSARLMSGEAEWETVKYAEKVKLNGSTMKNTQVFDALGGYSAQPELWMIKRNENGEIREIKTASVSNSYDPDAFTKTSETTRYYWSGDSSFNCRHYLKYDAIVILTPINEEDKYDEEQYDISTSGYFDDWKKYTYVAYNVDKFGYPDAFTVKDSQGSSSSYVYVNKVIKGVDDDGEAVNIIIGNYNGIEDLRIPEKPGAMRTVPKAGDVAEIKLRKGKITDCAITYSVGGAREYKAPVDDYKIHDGNTMVMGDVVDVDPERRMIIIDCETETLPIFVQNKADIEIFNADEEKFEIGSVNDIGIGSYARVTMGNNKVESVVVFR